MAAGRLDEEIACLKTILQCLEGSFRFHSNPLPLATVANTTSLGEATEFFELIVSLLTADSSPERLGVLVFDIQPNTIDLLLQLLQIPTPTHQLSNQQYAACRVLCIQTLTKIISLCTDETAAALLSERCLSTVMSANFVSLALSNLGGAGLGQANEGIRISFAESLFVLVMRSEMIAPSIIQSNGVPALFECLFADSSVMVRNYCCAILRVLAERSPQQFLNIPIVERATTQIKVEHSKYVVILLFEILSILFHSCPQLYLQRVHDDPHLLGDLGSVIQTFLTGNTNPDVLSSVTKLMETMLLLEGSTFGAKASYTVQLLTQGGPKILLNRDQGGDDVKAMKIKTFRMLCQACTTPELNNELHESYIHFFPTISLLVNGDGASTDQQSAELRTEVALSFATILAKNPLSRQYTNDTVKAYPVWINQLKQHLLSSIDAIPPPVLNGVYVLDINGNFLNNIANHSDMVWVDRVGIAQAVSQIFHEQELGTRSPVSEYRLIEESMYALPGQLTDMERKARLTHTILSHVVHTTLTAPLSLPTAANTQLPSYYQQMEQQTPLPAPSPFPVQQLSHGYTNFDSHPSEAFTDLQNYTTGEQRVTQPKSLGRSKSKDARLKKIMEHSEKLETRPPWNGGGRSGKKSLFSSVKTGKRTDFAPGSNLQLATSTPRTSTKYATDTSHKHNDYLDMAILMHLPITFGANYNRSNKPTIRRFNSGSSVPYVQQTCKSSTLQSWSVKDAGENDLFSFFIPFHKLCEERLDHELKRLSRNRISAKKGLLTTPQHLKGKRWFFYDLYHYILPKIETLLKDLKDLIVVHGTSNILFYLNIIRLMEQKNQEEQEEPVNESIAVGGALQHLGDPDQVDREELLQKEVLKLSSGKYKDTIHGGNILYVLDRLKAYFAENFSRGELQLSDHLKDIEQEIKRLEDKAARDILGNEAEAEAEDDVESNYDSTEDDAEPLKYNITGNLDNSHPLDDADFSTETDSDVNYNLERLRLADLDSVSDAPPPQQVLIPNQSTQPRHISPTRLRPGSSIPNPPRHPHLNATEFKDDDWGSDSSTLSF